MAPTRRKGASKAARHNWKVGDLVLAKVKGFPAWPATVSEPEKWGYSSDWKKVLVYFFGTQQIAFCNPADVEAFTEEKKQSLLVKRHGKSADFVHAVQEIVDSYEKLKKLDQKDKLGSGNDVSLAELQTNVGTIVQTETPLAAKNLQLTSVFPAKDGNESILPIKIALSTTEANSLLDEDVLLNDSMDTALAAETPVPVVYSLRKRSGDIQSKSGVSQRNRQAICRSGLRRVESCKSQNLMIPQNAGGKNDGYMLANLVSDGSFRQNKRIRKSPKASDCDDFNSDAFISNGSIEDIGSEIVIVDSDSYSLNEGGTETVIEYFDGDVELSKVLDLDLHATPAMKKKVQPNRKRVTKDAIEKISTLDMMERAEAVDDNNVHKSKSASETIVDVLCKEDGDKHLPLVKRARVRMGKPSFSEEDANKCSDAEKRNLKDATLEQSTEKSTCSIFADDSPIYKDSLEKKVSENLSLMRCSEVPGNESQSCNDKKDQQFLCIVDGEAALPPSKRLHRAFEAMSANAAEEGQACAERSIYVKASTNGSCTLPNKQFLVSPASSMTEEVIKLDSSFGNGCFRADPSAHVSLKVVEQSVKTTIEKDVCCQSEQISNSQRLGVNDPSVSSSDNHVSATQMQIMRPLFPGREQINRSNETTIYQLFSPKNDGAKKYFNTSNNKSKDCDKHFDAAVC